MLRYWYIVFFAAKVRVRFQANPDILYKVVFNGYLFTPRRIYAERSGIGTGFTPSTPFPQLVGPTCRLLVVRLSTIAAILVHYHSQQSMWSLVWNVFLSHST